MLFFVYLGMKNKGKIMNFETKFNPNRLRELYSAGSKKDKVGQNFWLSDEWDSRRTSFFDTDDEDFVKPKVDVMKLSSMKKAVSNFVSIVTQDPTIKVKFNSGKDSYTDGKVVVISSNTDDKLFNPTVGLALHEGSHCKLTDFEYVKDFLFSIPQEYINRAKEFGIDDYVVKTHLKNILNYVEDRRIDYYVFKTSPGYKAYYHSMYDKYFNSKIVDKALDSSEYTDETWESYEFRLINLTNKNTQLDALKGLREIYNLIDFKNIGRLKSTEDAGKIAYKIYDIILNNLQPLTTEEDSDGSENGDGDDSQEGTPQPSNGNEDGMSDGNFDLNDGQESNGGNQSTFQPSNELSDRQKKQLENAVKKQKKFQDGEITKKKVSKATQNELTAVEESGAEMVDVTEYHSTDWNGKKYYPKVLVYRNLTESLMDSDMVSIIDSYWYKNRDRQDYYRNTDENYVTEGIRLGTILGKKLQVRNDSRTTKWTRLDSGRIDKRLIAELGFGNDRVFQTSYTESYSDAIIHISVDASGSMGGEKWTKTMTSVVAITKAASMIQGLDVVVSFRSTQNTSGRYGRNGMYVPMILIGYDSRKDKFNKVKRYFNYIRPGGTTPEGLCFEAIMKEIDATTNDRDSFFLNLSDGMPMFNGQNIDYNGEQALNHTRKMVKVLRERGIKVMSYFIGDRYDYSGDRVMSNFKTMYGNDSQFIDTTNVTSLARTMNKRFLQK